VSNKKHFFELDSSCYICDTINPIIKYILKVVGAVLSERTLYSIFLLISESMDTHRGKTNMGTGEVESISKTSIFLKKCLDKLNVKDPNYPE
jgi:hypothetical protein